MLVPELVEGRPPCTSQDEDSPARTGFGQACHRTMPPLRLRYVDGAAQAGALEGGASVGKVAIIGLGLIGGSLGLAIKRAKPSDTTVIGYDRDWDVAQRAMKAGAVQQLADTPEDAVKDANLVIICHADPRTCAASSKTIGAAPARRAPSSPTRPAPRATSCAGPRRCCRDVHFVGGHPMAGKEKSGPARSRGVAVRRPALLHRPQRLGAARRRQRRGRAGAGGRCHAALPRRRRARCLRCGDQPRAAGHLA